jgi:hypothetical protein
MKEHKRLGVELFQFIGTYGARPAFPSAVGAEGVGQYIIALAKLAGVKTVNVVRRKEAAEQVRPSTVV